MAAQSLVLCSDPDVLRTLCPLLFDMDMGVEVCLGTNGASRILRNKKFDAVIVECHPDGTGLDVLQEIRTDTPNQSTITVGVVDDPATMKNAFATGANFVLAKPISPEDASRILLFTRSMVTRMVRRFLRIAVNHLAHVDIVGMIDASFMLDLSEGGMAIQALCPMERGSELDITFHLPGTTRRIEALAKVVWMDPTGRAGLEFTELAEVDRAELRKWVEQRANSSTNSVNSGCPTVIRVLSGWMKPLSYIVDAAVVVIAAALFCAIALVIMHGHEPAFPALLAMSALCLLIGGLYAAIFFLLDMRFPGNLAVQSLLAAASTRRVE